MSDDTPSHGMSAEEIAFRMKAHVRAIVKEFPGMDVHLILAHPGVGCHTSSSDDQQFVRAIKFLAKQIMEEEAGNARSWRM